MIKIRKIKVSELTEVYNLVVQLAIFENEPDAVTATLEDYQEAYKEGLITVIVAEKKSEIVGMAITYMTFSTWKGKMLYLEDFYVDASCRSEGIGQLIFDAYIKDAKERGCAMVKWQVLDWNTKAIKFYERNGATIEQEWWNGKIIF